MDRSYLICSHGLPNWLVNSQSGLRDCPDLTVLTQGQPDLYNTDCQSIRAFDKVCQSVRASASQIVRVSEPWTKFVRVSEALPVRLSECQSLWQSLSECQRLCQSDCQSVTAFDKICWSVTGSASQIVRVSEPLTSYSVGQSNLTNFIDFFLWLWKCLEWMLKWSET
jgi:hypothetical protein